MRSGWREGPGPEMPDDGPGWPGWPGRPGRRGRRDRGARRVVALALVVAFIQVLGTRAVAGHQHGGNWHEGLPAPAVVLLLAGPALLLLRRRWPLQVCAGTAAVAGLYLLLGYPYGPIVLSVAIGYVSAVLAGRRRAAWISLGALYLAHVVVNAATGSLRWPVELGVLAWLLLLVAAAELMRTRIEQRQHWRAARAEREARIADEQRLGIARELHDVLAHSISLINVQAGVALELIDDDPEQARTALTTIRDTSKQALGEVRQVLGTLRSGEPADRSPAPDLARLGDLVRQAGVAGLTVTVTRTGLRRALAAGIELAAFRIVQEGLTNVIRHSSARTAEVLLDDSAERLTVTVHDPGPTSATGGARAGGSGSGLAGMRERVGALGGSVEAGPAPGGGFTVRAELPLANGWTANGWTARR
ncbi:signal transduction histidine kinase [Streptacidiphilus sp. BW17]|uniref:sensor histidine kinase n=1 Tax=Streptacidiphilus sp. BW17 TaxID=3156274 RepID=UPI003517649E